MDRFITLACAAVPGDLEIEGSTRMLALLDGDQVGAVDVLGRGIAVLDTAPQRGPAPYLSMWPLLLAACGDVRAPGAPVTGPAPPS